VTNTTSRQFITLTLAAAAFVGATSQSLPPIVASHFGGSGTADGFMTRTFYTWFMLAFVVVLPALLTYLPASIFRRPGPRINLPHSDYWLAPERRDETMAYLIRHTARFGAALTLFLCYVHWLVLKANQSIPPRLDSWLFVGGLIAFLLVMVFWTATMLLHFYRLPRKDG
jgi:hypothetical protein